MSESAEAPWLPGRLHVAGTVLSTEPLATWWVAFDQVITDWKQTRYYVDARDVAADGFPHHPARLLGDAFPRLRALLAVTPVFALGDDLRAARIPGARVYSVGFARNADDFFSASASGPGIDRRLAGPLHDIEVSLCSGGMNPDAREALIDRILERLTDGRLSRRSLDLAEMWSALAGGPSLFVFDGEGERREYLGVREDGFEEVFTRAGSHLGEYEAILAALRTAEAAAVDRVELPGLGPGWRATARAATIKGPPTRPGGGPDVIVDCDGASEIVLPERRGWGLYRPLAPYEPSAVRAWRVGAGERARRTWARKAKERAALRRAALRRLTIFLAGLLLLIGGTCIYQLRKGKRGDPCREDSDCRSGVCRHDPELDRRLCQRP
jgi:hypothetical protein